MSKTGGIIRHRNRPCIRLSHLFIENKKGTDEGSGRPFLRVLPAVRPVLWSDGRGRSPAIFRQRKKRRAKRCTECQRASSRDPTCPSGQEKLALRQRRTAAPRSDRRAAKHTYESLRGSVIRGSSDGDYSANGETNYFAPCAKLDREVMADKQSNKGLYEQYDL